MALLQAFKMQGGPHDGERVDPPSDCPAPETLYLITFDDGAPYARADQRVGDSEGQLREVFRFDPDGWIAEQAKRRFTEIP
jgi:hypothetical protein